MDQSTLVSSARVLGLTSSLFVSGIYFSSSHLSLPLILPLAPSVSTSLFSKLYYSGAATVVPLIVVSSLANGYLSYELPAQRRLYAVAGAASFMTLPWTQLIMMPGIKRLLAMSLSKELLEKTDAGEVIGLLRTWGWMNHVRAASTLAGGLMGVLALV